MGLCALSLAAGACDDRTPRAEQGRAASTSPPASLEQLVGMRVMTPMTGTRPSRSLLARVRAGEVGGVILFGENVRTVSQVAALTRSLQRAAAQGGHPPLLVATDQEGGAVKRFASAPPSRSAADMGAAGPATARRQGVLTARALRRAGVNVNLAPVADVAARRNFLKARTFGRTPGRVAAAACAFAQGLREGRVAATLKHFPGLGHATGNTDEQAVSIRAPASRIRTHYAPYARCDGAAGLVMLSNAAYPTLDRSGRPAVLSPRIVGEELRRRAGFGGVTVSDAFEAPGPVAHRQAAVMAANAGVDLLLWGPGQDAAAQRAYRQLLAAARAGRIPRATLTESAARLRGLREQLG